VSGDIHKKEIKECEGRITEEAMQNSNTKFLPIDSVLIALNGQGRTRGSVALLRTKATCNQSIVSIFPKNIKELLPEYLYCNLNSRYDEIRKITGDDGNDRRGLNMPIIKEILIPVPPISEQERVVAFLNRILGVIEKAKLNTEINLENTKELFESYFQQIILNHSKNWQLGKLGEVCDLITDGTHFSPKNEIKGDYKYVTAKNIRPFIIDLTNISYISKKDHLEIYKRCPVKKGDVLYIKDGATAGIAAINTVEDEFSLLSSVALIKPSDCILNTFLVYYMNSIIGRKNFLKYIDGAAITRLTLVKIKNVIIPVPPISKQTEIVDQLNILSRHLSKLEVIYQNKRRYFEDFKKTVLQKAFAGELVKVPELLTA
jgi:type I restriction enzyme S subunit